jgi:hypothetical protein
MIPSSVCAIILFAAPSRRCSASRCAASSSTRTASRCASCSPWAGRACAASTGRRSIGCSSRPPPPEGRAELRPIRLDLWDGSRTWLPLVAKADELGILLERVALARAIPIEGAPAWWTTSATRSTKATAERERARRARASNSARTASRSAASLSRSTAVSAIALAAVSIAAAALAPCADLEGALMTGRLALVADGHPRVDRRHGVRDVAHVRGACAHRLVRLGGRAAERREVRAEAARHRQVGDQILVALAQPDLHLDAPRPSPRLARSARRWPSPARARRDRAPAPRTRRPPLGDDVHRLPAVWM